ncbi:MULTISPECIES: polyprenyl synthetase family protein [Aeromicrobium]|uniref:Polyprenyl synthetase family protein n=1 Tax=Aeromicrobium yanjiei TaxID=2662028 RepID=A0A5Q2MGF8_9ACTN|nr:MULTISPECIES: polyprenyl synthetase family protein [Aeromicrobium]MRK02527.1 polyprenyl synthetase family protein [Aeromicrobium sp. S22]QGG40136.1 polyprenyl synthetase family protein [Aeromicrobium yanjiei]
MTATAEHAAADRREDVSAAAFLTRVERRLDAFLAERSRVLLEVSPDLQAVARVLRDMSRGGKRLRASFGYWGWHGTGTPVSDEAVDAAAALEVFHLAALVHDDLMDHSATRRGVPTAHTTFAELHREGDLLGDAVEFGHGAALLIGDLCLTWSDELLDGSLLDPTRRAAARRVYNLMRTQVVAGQYLDVLEQSRHHTTVEAARTVLQFKSAKYTVEHPLMLGGASAGAGPELLGAYSAYGLPIGEAFQLRDDVLGVFGDETRTGKPVGDDLREGKKTLLVLVARDRADRAGRERLDAGLGNRELDAHGVAALQEILVETGALDLAEQRIAELTSRGVDAIRASDVPEPTASGLAALAERIAGRAA